MTKKARYQFEVEDDGAFKIYSKDREIMFLHSNGVPMRPVSNRAANWSEPSVEFKNDRLTYSMPSNALYDRPQAVVEFKDDYVEFYFKATVKHRMALHKWHLFERGSTVNALEVLNYRSHINSPSAYEVNQTILARRRLGTQGCSVNTEDGDMMFAPHPQLFVFKNLEEQMTIAPMERLQAESCHFKLYEGQTKLKDYCVCIGDSLYWLEEGEALESPHFMITLTNDTLESGGYKMLQCYSELLVKEGIIRPKQAAEQPAWWGSPIWCSWGDQHTHLDSEDVVSTAFTAQMRQQATDAIRQEFVDRVVDRIAEHDLPVRTLLVDDKWYTHWGDMKVDETKFPNFRGYVDSLHDKGFKMMAWASIWRFSPESELYKKHPEWFLIHHYKRDHHNLDNTDVLALDFSIPEAAEAYIGELMRRMLSDDPGCYNLDGIKFDWPFLIPHDYAYEDRRWVGKETTIYRTQKLLYDKAKEIKPDSLIIGVSPHPFFQDAQDMIRTYDVSTCDIRVHLERAAYIKSLCPGMPVGMDEHVFYQRFFRYLKESARVGVPMIYNLLRFNGDGHAYTADDYARVKQILDDYVGSSPKLKEYMKSLPTIGK